MKKLLGTTLALALFVPAGANAELLKNLKVGGQLDMEAVSANNVTDLATHPDTILHAVPVPPASASGNDDRIGEADLRLILRADWDLLDDVHSRVTLVKGGNADGNANNRTFGSGGENITTVENNTYVEEAFVKVDKLVGDVDATVGRQFYGDPGDLIIYYGPRNDYGLTTSALDIARFDWSNDMVAATGIVGKTVGNAIGATAGTATDLRGLTATFKIADNLNPNVYLYDQVIHHFANTTLLGGGVTPNTTPNANLYVAGVKDKASWGGLYASGEVAKNFGDSRGWALLGRTGYKTDMMNAGLIHPWGEIGLGSGGGTNTTFQAINTDYRPGGIYGLFDAGAPLNLGGAVGAALGADSNGLSNKFIWGLGVKFTPAALDKFTGGLQFYKYAFQQDVTATIAGVPTFVGKNIGSEFDITGEWKHSENVSTKLMLGTFQPGETVYNANQTAIKALGRGVNPAVLASADLTVKF